jgi:EmrB/QacA subfamily drug resistance transporter
MSAVRLSTTPRQNGQRPVTTTPATDHRPDRDEHVARRPNRAPGVVAIASVVVLGSITTVIDMTAMHVAFGRLAQEFGAPIATIQWVATGYTLALATVIPVAPWVMARFGTTRAFMAALSLFTLGSVLVGLAWDIGSLVAFRAVQGLGGGLIVPVGLTIIVQAADPARLGRAMSLLGIPVLIGPIAGPVLGGWLVDHASWRWIFFLNAPIGILALVLAAAIFPKTTPQRDAHLDVWGLLMLSPGLVALIYGLVTGGGRGEFSSIEVVGSTVVGAALVIGFVTRALTTRAPLIDLRLFRRRPFATAAGTLVLFNCAYFGSMLLLPLYYQLVRGHTATEAGLLGIPQVLATGIAMQLATRMVDRVSPGKLVPIGVTVAGTGFLTFLTQVTADSPYWLVIGALVVTGVGVGMTIMPNITAATRSVPAAQVPVASAALNIIQQVTSAVGTALISVVLATSMASRVPGIADGGLGQVRELSARERQLIAADLADAFQHTYGWAVALMLLAIVPAVFIPRRQSSAATMIPGDN